MNPKGRKRFKRIKRYKQINHHCNSYWLNHDPIHSFYSNQSDSCVNCKLINSLMWSNLRIGCILYGCYSNIFRYSYQMSYLINTLKEMYFVYKRKSTIDILCISRERFRIAFIIVTYRIDKLYTFNSLTRFKIERVALCTSSTYLLLFLKWRNWTNLFRLI